MESCAACLFTPEAFQYMARSTITGRSEVTMVDTSQQPGTVSAAFTVRLVFGSSVSFGPATRPSGVM